MPGIIEILMRDLSWDPYVQEGGVQAAFFDRANFWNTRGAQANEVVVLAIRQASQETVLSSPATSLQFDMNILRAAARHLQFAPVEARSQFSQIASEVINEHRVAMDFLTTLPDIPAANSILQGARGLSEQLGRVARDVGDWGHRINEGVGLGLNVAAQIGLPVPDSIRDVLTGVQRFAGDVETTSRDVGQFIEGLWGAVEGAVGANPGGAPGEHGLDGLNRYLLTLSGSTEDAVRSIVSREIAGVQNTLTNVRAGFQAAAQLVGLFGGNPKLASDMMAIGEASVSIGGSIATLIGGSLAGGPAMPVIAIVGAVGAIISRLFGGGGPDPHQVILEQMQRLGKHIDARFDRVEHMIVKAVEHITQHIDQRFKELAQHLDGRFDRIEGILGYLGRDMLREFSVLRAESAAQYVALILALRNMANRVDHVHRDLIIVSNELYHGQNYLPARLTALREANRELINDAEHVRVYGVIVDWISVRAASAITTGHPNAVDLLDRVNQVGPFLNIQALKNRAIALTERTPHPISDPGALVNPAIWAEGVRTFLKYFTLTPQLYALNRRQNGNSTIPQDLDQIEGRGLAIQGFISNLRTNQGLFDQLISNYKTALQSLLHEVYRLTVTTDGVVSRQGEVRINSTEPAEAIRQVETIELMNIFLRQELPSLERLNLSGLANVNGDGVQVAKASVPGDDQKTPHREIELRRAIGKFMCHPELKAANNAQLMDFIRDDQRTTVVHMRDNGIRDDGTGHIPGECGPADKPYVDAFGVAIDRWRCLENIYLPTRAEADALRVVATDLFGRASTSSNEYTLLKTDADRHNRKRFILAHAATTELTNARAAGRLPHAELMKDYFQVRDRGRRNALLTAAAQPGSAAPVAASLEPLLTELQRTFDELVLFISVAFPRQYVSDPLWLSTINTLWTRERFESYLRAGTAPADFIGVVLQNLLEPQGAVDLLKDFIAQHVQAAAVIHRHGSDYYDYPLITQVLQELAEFRRATELILQMTPADILERIPSVQPVPQEQVGMSVHQQPPRNVDIAASPVRAERQVSPGAARRASLFPPPAANAVSEHDASSTALSQEAADVIPRDRVSSITANFTRMGARGGNT